MVSVHGVEELEIQSLEFPTWTDFIAFKSEQEEKLFTTFSQRSGAKKSHSADTCCRTFLCCHHGCCPSSTTGVLSVTSQNTAETTAVYDVEAEDAAEGTVLLSGAEPAWCVLRWSEYENVDRTKKEKAMEIMNEPEEEEEAEIYEGQDCKIPSHIQT